MGKSCLIISGGEFCKELPERSYDMVIACDKGVKYAEMLDVVPDHVIGDFDSLETGELSVTDLFPKAVITRLDPEKDDPDTMSAVKLALTLGADDITITCCTGGRLDHTLGNIQAGAYFAANANVARLMGENDIIYILSGLSGNHTESTFVEYSDGGMPYSGPRSYRIKSDPAGSCAEEYSDVSGGCTGNEEAMPRSISIPRKEGWSISVIALSDICTGVSITGAKYNLTDSELSNTIPLGISNEWASEAIEVSIKKGILMVACSRMP